MYLSLRKADFLLFFIFIAAAALIAAVPLVRSSDGAPMVRIIAWTVTTKSRLNGMVTAMWS